MNELPSVPGAGSVSLADEERVKEVLVASVLVMGLTTIVYTYLGGMAAVIWTDVIQLVIYLVGAGLAAVILLDRIPGGWAEVVRVGDAAGKFTLFDFTLSITKSYTFWSGVIGGAFLTTATHGTDQLMVQRYLCASSPRQARVALLTSGAVVFAQFTLFLLIGSMLYAYYSGHATAEMAGVTYGETLPSAPSTFRAGDAQVSLLIDTPRRRATPAPDTKVLAQFGDGSPVVTERTLGRGNVLGVHFGADVELEKNDNPALVAYLAGLVQQASRPAVVVPGEAPPESVIPGLRGSLQEGGEGDPFARGAAAPLRPDRRAAPRTRPGW